MIQEKTPGHPDPEIQLSGAIKSIDLAYVHSQGSISLLIIDNGSTEEAERSLRSLSYPDLSYIKHRERARGMVEVINEAWKVTHADLLAFMHSDFYILGEDWDREVREIAIRDSKLGIIGFGGGYGMGPGGYRYGFASNMVDANLHGVHRWVGSMPAIVLDGMIMIMTRKMLDQVQGIPAEYKVHHFYDLHMSLASVYAGFHNYVLFVRCKHGSSKTRMAPGLDGMEVYNHNREVFLRRWSKLLPVYVTSDFKLVQGYPPKMTHEPHYFPGIPRS